MTPLSQLLSRKSDAVAAAAPHWHPNFRNYEKLPDTKVVRTAFFINTAAAAVAFGLLAWTAYQHLQISNLNQQIQSADTEIASKAAQNKEALRLSKAFADEEKRIQELAKFTAAGLQPSDFLELLGQTLPEHVAIRYVDIRLAETGGGSPTIVLRGRVSGSPDQASGIASNYVEVFRVNKSFVALVDKADMTNVNRDAATQSLLFEIVLKLKGEGKEKKL